MSRKLRSIFAMATVEGREVMGAEEFLLAASIAGMTRLELGDALADGVLRSGITGYWLAKAADPGAMSVMRAALAEAVR